jgi:tetratricopeptide (TPR) repeat protein/predicted Ser/Thr protein kinase
MGGRLVGPAMQAADLKTRPIPSSWQPPDAPPRATFGHAGLAEVELPQPNLGDSVGRYTVLDLLGRGGMGAVYKAYDPQLDRNVALKLLRRVPRDDEQGSENRLLREAQMLAQLQHPNVVAVFDAGLCERGVFIAMELFEGRTLREWLDERPRQVDEVLRVFRAAGRGLAAAHEAGFVHRDFKPANVLVGHDGSVRVLDFGIAALMEPTTDDRSGASGSSRREVARPPGVVDSLSNSSSGAQLTDHGMVMGTPPFMAPEQVAGAKADHRSDQFSFCVCLHVALYGRSPVVGRTFEERRMHMARGRVIDEHELLVGPTAGPVPRRVRRALVRGLSVEPARRLPTMQALVAQLEPPARRWPAAIAGAMLVSGFAAGAMVFAKLDDRCAEPAAALEEVWNDEDRERVHAAVVRSGHVQASALHDRVEQQLDTYATSWTEMYAESCRATFVTQQQSERLHDLRMQCLRRRRDRLRSAIDALVEITEPQQAIDRTVLPFVLPSLSECADLEAVMAIHPLPSEPAARDRIAELRRRLDGAQTLQAAGELQPGLKVAQAAVDAAREEGFAPVLAEALGVLGSLQAMGGSARDAEATLEASIREAARAKDDLTAAKSWTWLVYALVLQRRLDEGLSLELAAQAAVDRADDDEVRGWLLNNLGALYSEHGEFPRAREHLQEAITVKTSTLGPGHVDVGISWANLGTALADHRLHNDARDAFERARTVFERTVGTAHPLTYYAVGGLCRAEEAGGRYAQAVELCARVLEHFEVSPSSQVTMGRTRYLMARALHGSGRSHEAREQARLALELVREEDPGLAEELAEWLAALPGGRQGGGA